MPDFFELSDITYEPDRLFQKFKSCIWTEGYNNNGRFEMVAPLGSIFLSRGNLVGKSDSRYFMIIDAVEENEKEGTVKFVGKSSDTILKWRPTLRPDRYTSNLNWKVNARPSAAAIHIARYALDPTLVPTSSYAIDAITSYSDQSGGPGSVLTNIIPISNSYDEIKKLCDSVNIGWRLLRTYGGQTLAFQVYKGVDRSDNQTVNSPVRFTTTLGTLSNASRIQSAENYASRAMVYTSGNAVYYKNTPYQSVFDPWLERVIAIDATSIKESDTTATELSQALNVLNQNAFSAHKLETVIDGDARIADSPYKYGTDYNLGDLVTIAGDNFSATARVVEHITSVDAEGGVREYPAFRVDSE